MKTKRIVISGGPGSGKTTLIDHLSDLGYDCLPEISREVTLEAQKQGIAQLFLTDPVLFSKKLLYGRLDQFHEGPEHNASFVFYDRGMPDVTAYMDYLGTEYSDEFGEICMAHRYDAVFLLPPWEEIYQSDNERYESWEEAQRIYTYLLNGYRNYKYEPHVVPVGTIPERASEILNKLDTLF